LPISITYSFVIEPLGKYHDRAAFSCGVEPLDRYFKQQAGQESRRHIAYCFTAVSQAMKAIGGYYTLSATAVIFDSLPDAFKKKLPRYPEVPAALVGRLAVDLHHRGKRLGETLLLDAMHRTLQSGLAAAILVVDPKDEQTARFYYRYGFLDIGPGRTRLYLPVSEIGEALPSAR
jgi:ribosomal protein S18 acetylase RimI-like enzyme